MSFCISKYFGRIDNNSHNYKYTANNKNFPCYIFLQDSFAWITMSTLNS